MKRRFQTSYGTIGTAMLTFVRFDGYDRPREKVRPKAYRKLKRRDGWLKKTS